MRFILPPRLSVLDIIGQDAARVLNNLCTAAVLQLQVGEGREAFITDVRGRTLGHVCVYRHEDRLRLIGAAGQAEAIAAHLDRYTIREDAAAIDRSADWAGLLVAEEGLPRVDPSCRLDPPSLPQSLVWQPLANTAAGGPEAAGAEAADALAVYRVPWIGGYVLAAGATAEINALTETLQSLGDEALDESAFHTARVAQRFPWFGIDLDDRNLPQEADRDPVAISFTKGCYLGQETVARLDALGQVQKKLVLWRIDAPQPPAAGTELTAADRVVGRLTSVVPDSAGNGFLALGYARRSHFDAGAEATYKGESEQPVGAVVV